MEKEQPFSNLIYEYYLMRFRFGYYKPGDTLPPVEILCQEFRVAENTVKTALRRLREEGYIDLRGGHATKVLFEQTEQEYRNYITGFYSKRREAHSDLYASAGPVFIPLLLEGLRRMSGEELDTLAFMAKRGETDDLLRFNYLLLEKLNNPLVMNLFWETLFFWGVPFSRREGRPSQYAPVAVRERISRLLDGAKAQSWDCVRDALLTFQRGDFSAADGFLRQNIPPYPKEGQIPFVWRIYREHPQICFSLSVQLLHEIYMGSYRQRTYLPSYAAMAKLYGASVSTVRRTIAGLHEIGAVEPVNGKGIRICPIGEPCETADFSNTTVLRNLSYYIQAFDLGRYTCEGVTRDFLQTLAPEVRDNLIRRLEKELRADQCVVSVFHFLNCVVNHHPLQGIREIYGTIYALFLWGAPLKGSTGETPEPEQESVRFTRLMIQAIKENDAEGCAAAVKELLDGHFAAAERFLRQKGLSPEALRFSSTIHFSLT